ncbi:AEC family transporter [Acaryochloris sp. 'Moss Beach']|uniref:AEC family transporter n=1 Tax=Acaryochloris sp. 'Moss Beach' TaxID=2740837 RepID=UPI001F15D772|nr:AEC family transporter [Acaryochloris sp. 'Moss Beach']UJB68525.1 AEC family transporter [Acaryochloris sp. 'Moss Beach']
MTALLPAILPVSLIICIGYIAGKTLKLDYQTLSHLAIYILVPALIASSLYRNTLSLQSATGLIAGYLLTTVTLAVIVLLLSQGFKLPTPIKMSLLATTLFGNAGNLGLPMVSFTLGAAGLERAIIYLIAASILMAGVGPALLNTSGIRAGIALTLKLPLFWAMLAGLLLQLSGFQLPFRLDEGVAMLGNAAIPIALVTLGMQLAQTPLRLGKYELLAASLRLIMAPLIALGIGTILQLAPLDLKVLVLQSAMPTAVNTLIWVNEFGGDPSRVARTIIGSTLLSLITLPMMLGLIQSIGT